MRYRRIGELQVSVIGLGGNNFGLGGSFGCLDKAATQAVVHAALDAGIGYIDTADRYSDTQSESFLGCALRGRRQDVVVATKFGGPVSGVPGSAQPDYVRRAVDGSLRRLGVDVIDVYQLHQPDPFVPLAETIGCLQDLGDAGKIREYGCANFDAKGLAEARRQTPDDAVGFASVQGPYNVLARAAEREVLPECRRQGMAFIPYYPLAIGLLTGKYRRGVEPPQGSRLAVHDERRKSLLTERNLDIVDKLTEFAHDRGRTLLQLAFARLLAEGAVATVIAGASRPEQAITNAAAADWVLDPEEVAEVDRLAPVVDGLAGLRSRHSP